MILIRVVDVMELKVRMAAEDLARERQDPLRVGGGVGRLPPHACARA